MPMSMTDFDFDYDDPRTREERANFRAMCQVGGEEDANTIAILILDTGVSAVVSACFAEDAGMLVNDGWIR